MHCALGYLLRDSKDSGLAFVTIPDAGDIPAEAEDSCEVTCTCKSAEVPAQPRVTLE